MQRSLALPDVNGWSFSERFRRRGCKSKRPPLALMTVWPFAIACFDPWSSWASNSGLDGVGREEPMRLVRPGTLPAQDYLEPCDQGRNLVSTHCPDLFIFILVSRANSPLCVGCRRLGYSAAGRRRIGSLAHSRCDALPIMAAGDLRSAMVGYLRLVGFPLVPDRAAGRRCHPFSPAPASVLPPRGLPSTRPNIKHTPCLAARNRGKRGHDQ